jgi:manganese/zinc/iron transport system ATP- binding protein
MILFPALEVVNLSLAYDAKNIIFAEESCLIPQGVACAIIGLNGAGKTSFLRSVLGLEQLATGTITFFGKSFWEINDSVAYIPQIKTVDWSFPITVENVVKMGCYRMRSFLECSLDDNSEEMIGQSLKAMNLYEKKDAKINDLSGGQKQRVFLARALAQNPNLYLFDEPFTGVDIKSEEIISTIFKELIKKNKTIIAVHHDLTTLYEYFNYVVIINKGILYQGPLEREIVTPFITKAFSY